MNLKSVKLKNNGHFLMFKFLAFMVFAIISGCGTQGGDTTVGGGTVTLPTTTSVSAIQVLSSTASVSTGGTATITVTLLDSSGEMVSDDKVVTFVLDNPALGSIPSPILVSGGTTSQTFIARTVPGNVNISAFVDDVNGSAGVQISDAVQAASVTVAVAPSTISLGGTSLVSATVRDAGGAAMPDGTSVNFALNNIGIGSISSTATTTSGVATVTFLADIVNSGTGTITATSGSVSGSGPITVNPAATGSIEFNSAAPQVVGIQGSGQPEVSTVSFAVKDINGNLVADDEQVTISMTGPNGGEYLGDIIPTVFPAPAVTVGTVSGLASVKLHSGTIPGTVTLIATVNSTGQSTASGVVSIGGGKPSAAHFTLATSQFNLPGLRYVGRQATISAYIADRYGNYNVLNNSTVSLDAECGGIDTAVSLDAVGTGSVIYRTQNPIPGDTDIVGHDLASPTHFTCTGLTGAILEECLLASSYYTAFGVDMVTDNGVNNPRDGLCTITAHINGEEEFTDTNANGLYDFGEPFDDSYDDTFMDKDDDNLYNQDPSLPEDLIVDDNLNNIFDGLNGVWDSDKTISNEMKLVITNEPSLKLVNDAGVDCVQNPGGCSFQVGDGFPDFSRSFTFTFHDENFNRPAKGSTMTVTTDAGKLTGVKTSDFPDSSALGSPIFSVTISDDEVGDSNPAQVAEIKFSVSWEGITKNFSIFGTVN